LLFRSTSYNGGLSPSIHKFDNEFIQTSAELHSARAHGRGQSKPSGLSAALGHELGPNGVSNFDVANNQNTLMYLRIEALRWNRNAHAAKTNSPEAKSSMVKVGNMADKD